jgi:3',5'-cyclic AMP phosphodiesterase CpdA
MRFLVTADLHLARANRAEVCAKLGRFIAAHQPDALIVAGDIVVASDANQGLRALRDLFPDGPLLIALGNHDFWLTPGLDAAGIDRLESVLERYWIPAAKECDVTLLDVENFFENGCFVAGGYGHYDLGFAVHGLQYNGRPVLREHYLSGTPPFETSLRWRDFDYQPGNGNPLAVASRQVAAVEQRLADCAELEGFVILHTPPFAQLLGIAAHPSADGQEPSPYAFFRAYLGNAAMGEMLLRTSARLFAVACGHTHRPVDPVDLGGFIGMNIGSDYGQPRACLVDSARKTATRL